MAKDDLAEHAGELVVVFVMNTNRFRAGEDHSGGRRRRQRYGEILP